MEKILKQNEWSVLYEITDPPFSKPRVFVLLGVKYCPRCKHAYCMRFGEVFYCWICGFKYHIKTPFWIKVKNFFAYINPNYK